MKPGRHAYAPGVKGYRPLRLQLDSQPLLCISAADWTTFVGVLASALEELKVQRAEKNELLDLLERRFKGDVVDGRSLCFKCAHLQVCSGQFLDSGILVDRLASTRVSLGVVRVVMPVGCRASPRTSGSRSREARGRVVD